MKKVKEASLIILLLSSIFWGCKKEIALENEIRGEGI